MNHNTESRKNKHLNERERYAIELYLREKYTIQQIAKRLGRHKRTIEREIARGTVYLQNSDLSYRKAYCADVGQRKYIENGKNKGPQLKIGNDHKLTRHIETKIIKGKYSPDAVIGEIKAKGLKFKTSICTKTLNNYIDRGDVFLKLTNKELPVKKDGKKRIYQKVKKIALKNIKGRSIEERPQEVEDRVEYGHWEMDCVVGKKENQEVLLVLSERKTREEIIFKIPNKTQDSVIKAIDELEFKYKEVFREKFKTITVDNGSEFLNFKELERSTIEPGSIRTKIYYAHPYSSWERGTNENINKLIRRFIPKGTDISKISTAKIKSIEKWINNYPRRIFGYKSANEIAAAC
ncbi:MAG: IS30 family transposase [Clostridiaceae bacterium]|nr:IS30 family transposase [Clostridiaceae bacterium]